LLWSGARRAFLRPSPGSGLLETFPVGEFGDIVHVDIGEVLLLPLSGGFEGAFGDHVGYAVLVGFGVIV